MAQTPRLAWASLMVALLLLSVPSLAQEGEEGPEVVDHGTLAQDTEGDVTATSSVLPASPGGTHTSVDLTGLSAEETEEDLIFHLQVVDLDTTAPGHDTLRIYFQYDDARYRAVIERVGQVVGSSFNSYLEREYAPDQWDYQDWVRLQFDAQEETYTVHVFRDAIANQQGVRPIPGHPLTAFYATGHATDDPNFFGIDELESAYASYEDRMPDEGESDAVIDPTFGIRQTGHAYLDSPEPIRDSNGEASTFVFRVGAHNLDENADVFTFRFADVPEGWDVRMASTTVTIKGEEVVEVPIVVRTPFSHEHGNVTTFLVEMESRRDPAAVGRMEMGLNFLEIPQPAGHHDTVYLHGYNGWQLTMNTLEDDPNGDNESVQPEACWWMDYEEDTPLERTEYCWLVRLRPGLSMGLDFDLSRLGAFQTSVSSQLDLQNAELKGRLTWYGDTGEEDGYGERILANLTVTDPKTIAAGATEPFETVVVPTEAADLVAYYGSADLYLQLKLTGDRIDEEFTSEMLAPRMVPGGFMRLPLYEYSDPIDEVFGATGTVSLRADVQERFVNPDKTVVYNVTLRNDGPFEDAFLLDVTGTNEGWAELLRKRAITISADDSATIALSVAAPADAADGTRADLILEALSSTDSNSRALIRLVTTVDTDAVHGDEAALADEIAARNQESPTGGALLALAAAALVALVTRRVRRL